MFLRHRCLCAIKYVVNQLASIGKVVVVAIEVTCLFLVGQVEMVATRASTDVTVFADLDKSICTDYRESAIAPGAEAVGSKPINADIAGTPISS